jgi:hypothetical protein
LESDRTLTVTASADLFSVASQALFTGTLTGPSGGIGGADVQALLTRPDGVTATVQLSDTGGGVYTGTYAVPDSPGYLVATFTAVGNDAGTPFTRQVDRLFAIAPHGAYLSGTYADYLEDPDSNAIPDYLALDVGLTATDVGTYTLSAELFLEDQLIAHTTDYFTLTVGSHTKTLRFDGRDIWHSHLDGPYTVTNVHLVDLNAGPLPAQVASDVWLTSAYDWIDFGGVGFLPVVLKYY